MNDTAPQKNSALSEDALENVTGGLSPEQAAEHLQSYTNRYNNAFETAFEIIKTQRETLKNNARKK